jgi:integrase
MPRKLSRKRLQPAEAPLDFEENISVDAPPRQIMTPTYEAVLAQCAAALPKFDVRLVTTAIHKWLALTGQVITDLAVELDVEVLQCTLDRMASELEIAGFSAATIANYRTGLRKAASACQEIIGPVTPDTTAAGNRFWARVISAAEALGLKGAKAWYLRKSAMVGRMPRTVERVTEVAALVGLDPAELLPLVWIWDPPRLFDLQNPNYVWNAGHSNRTQSVYALAALPEAVAKILDPFFDWRAGRCPARLEVRLLDGTTKVLKRESLWSRRGSQAKDEFSATEKIVREFFLGFFGFLTLSADAPDPMLRGVGISEEDLRASHVFLSENIIAYCEFQKARNGRFDHYGLAKLRQDYGLLIGSKDAWGRCAQADLYQELMAVTGDKCPTSPAEWQNWCDDQVHAIDDWIEIETKGRRGRDKFQKARSPEDALAQLLDLERPMAEVVWPTIYWLIDNKPPAYYPLYDRMRFGRKIFVMTALAAEPHRIENWQGMIWSRHLYKRDGLWQLMIPASEFKNRRKLSKPYRSAIEPAAQPIFEAYYQLWKEAFGMDPLSQENIGKTCYVLAQHPGTDPSRRPCHEIVRSHLVLLVELWNITVGPHAMRHTWATDYLKRHPGDYATVAGKFHEKVDTVAREYAHLSSMDHSRNAARANGDQEKVARQNLSEILRNKTATRNKG